ncbi:MAG: hypothetical protein ABI688_04595 [Bacteroidota bacterium]
MRTLFFPVLLIVLVSCGGSSSVISKQLSGSDSLVINFNTPQTNTIGKTMNTTEKTAIKKLANYVDSKTATTNECGYDGNLVFYKQGVVTGDLAFNYSTDSCHHFMMLEEGKLTPTVMSSEAADFLKSLSEGRPFY